MRVLLTLYSTSFGGAEESVLNLAQGLARHGVEVYVLWLSSYPLVLPRLKKVKMVHWKISGRWYEILAPWLVAVLCIKYQIQLVNLNWRYVDKESQFLNFLGVKAAATVRAILLDRSDTNEYRYADAIVGISQAVIDRVKELGYKKNCHLIYNGIEMKQLRLFDEGEKNPYKLLSMSRLVKWKRVDWSVRAVHQLKKQGLPMELDIYGEGPEEISLRALITELEAENYIKMKGRINRNDKKLSEYGIFVVPSFAEPFGKTVVENVIRGKVVVGTNYGGIPELLKDYDLLFERDSFDDFVKKISSAIESYSRYEKEIKKRREYFRRYYDMERVVREYKKVYETMLK